MNYNRVKEFLAKRKKTSNELAESIGRKPQTVSTWCRNVNQPEIPTLFKIAEFLGVEAGELLTVKAELIDIEKKKAPPKNKGPKKS